MKLQINTSNKTITIEESINLGELYELLIVMFPKFGWKEYTIHPVATITEWINPIPWTPQPWINPITPFPVITPYTIPTNPIYPTVTCGTEMHELRSQCLQQELNFNSIYNLTI